MRPDFVWHEVGQIHKFEILQILNQLVEDNWRRKVEVLVCVDELLQLEQDLEQAGIPARISAHHNNSHDGKGLFELGWQDVVVVNEVGHYDGIVLVS